jgi:hypothetical protein
LDRLRALSIKKSYEKIARFCASVYKVSNKASTIVSVSFTSKRLVAGLTIGFAGILSAISATPANAFFIVDPCSLLFAETQGQDVTLPEGCTPTNPILPDSEASTTGQFVFPNIIPRRWYDPPFVSRYDYSLDAGNFLSFILPPSSGNTIDLYIGDTLKASNLLGDGSTEYSFSQLVPSIDVTSFSLRDITPLRDAADPTAFPVFLDFTTASSGLTITPVPGPLPALGVSAAFAFSRKLRRRINASAR